jgi:hypothetical protein
MKKEQEIRRICLCCHTVNGEQERSEEVMASG